MPYESLQTKVINYLLADDGTVNNTNDPSWTGPVTPLVGALSSAIPADPIYLGLLQGGLYDRPIKYDGDANTPYAFYKTARGGEIRACGSVGIPPRTKHRQADAIYGAYSGILRISLYCPRSRDGKDRMEQACIRIRQLLQGWSFASEEGPKVFVDFEDFVEPTDTEEFVGAKSTYCRIQLTGRYGNDV